MTFDEIDADEGKLNLTAHVDDKEDTESNDNVKK